MKIFKPAQIKLDKRKNFKHHQHRPGLAREYVRIKIPEFSITDLPWKGSSFIAVEFVGEMDTKFTIRFPVVTKPAAPNFMLAVRWIDNDGGFWRRKLWENVGEKVSYPPYNSQWISQNFVLEAWTTEHSTEVSADEIVITTSPLVLADKDSEKCKKVAFDLAAFKETEDHILKENAYLFAAMYPYAQMSLEFKDVWK